MCLAWKLKVENDVFFLNEVIEPMYRYIVENCCIENAVEQRRSPYFLLKLPWTFCMNDRMFSSLVFFLQRRDGEIFCWRSTLWYTNIAMEYHQFQ